MFYERIKSLLLERRTEKGKGSKAGRAMGMAAAKGGGDRVETEKSKVKVYDSIKQAIQHGGYGHMFSTKGSKRLYVITKPTWGKKSRSGGNRKVAKGFSKGIPHSFRDVKKYALRTLRKHGKSSVKKNGD